MDPGEVSNKFQDLIKIEKILIAWIFPIMSVYKLRKGQHRYYENVINFFQDVQEFASKLPQHLSLLDVLII